MPGFLRGGAISALRWGRHIDLLITDVQMPGLEQRHAQAPPLCATCAGASAGHATSSAARSHRAFGQVREPFIGMSIAPRQSEKWTRAGGMLSDSHRPQVPEASSTRCKASVVLLQQRSEPSGDRQPAAEAQHLSTWDD